MGSDDRGEIERQTASQREGIRGETIRERRLKLNYFSFPLYTQNPFSSDFLFFNDENQPSYPQSPSLFRPIWICPRSFTDQLACSAEIEIRHFNSAPLLLVLSSAPEVGFVRFFHKWFCFLKIGQRIFGIRGKDGYGVHEAAARGDKIFGFWRSSSEFSASYSFCF